MQVLVGFDPGRDKCGVAVVSTTGNVIEHQVVTADVAVAQLQRLVERFTVAALIVGDRTTSKAWQAKLRDDLQPTPLIRPVDEHRTTLLARDRYWEMFPPKGLIKLLPHGLREPPRPIDDIVAILLVERYLASR